MRRELAINGHASWWKSFVIAALLSTVASLLIVAAGPALSEPNDKAKGGDSADHGNSEEAQAAHGNDGNGSDNGNGTVNDNGNGAEAAISGTTTGSTDDGNGNGNGGGNKHDDTSTAAASSGGSEDNGNGNKHGPDPDPVQTQSPPATKGPPDCPDYSQESGGPYDHNNCDGSQGQHGNGGNGKCAGCTGKADDKSPGGQYPGDHNNGYECDHNNGVGKGNPAHSRCGNTPPPCTVDLDPNTPGLQCQAPSCTTNCNPPPDCTGDNDPNNNQSCFPTVCPPDSDLAGQPLPGGDVRNCYETPPPVCPPGSNLAGQPLPGGDVANCFTAQPPPVCPEGTDLAGQPLPLGNITLCDEDVLGDRIHNDGDIDGNMQERPAIQGKRILPFTGASIVGYLLLALELVALGLFAMRARRRRG